MVSYVGRSLSFYVLAALALPLHGLAQPGELPSPGSSALPCPFVDGDGGSPGIQVTGNVTVDDVDDGGGSVGDFYNCTASLVRIKTGVTVTLGSNTATGGIAEIHFSDLVIEAGAAVSADGQGYAGVNGFASTGNGPGGGVGGNGAGAGGGYGGEGGGTAGGASYGSLTQPGALGSAGGYNSCCFQGSGANGGGAVKLFVSGSMTLDGLISSGGSSTGTGLGTQSGGSGGSVWIETGALSGSGTVMANGGSASAAEGGSGGGGRIAVHYSTSTHTVVMQARSGAVTGAFGGAGTVYEKDIDTDVFDLTLHNGSVVAGRSTPIASAEFGGENVRTLTLNRASVPLTGSITIETDTTINQSSLTVSGSMVVEDDLTLASSALTVTTLLAPLNSVSFSGTSSLSTPVLSTTQALTIPSGATVRHPTGSAAGLTIVAPDVTVASGGSINLDGLGLPGNTSFSVSGNGPGAGGPGSGGGYGGTGGGSTGGGTYGSAQHPTDLGSSGGHSHCCFQGTGGAGGGKLKIETDGTVAIEGTLSAKGATGSGVSGEHTGGSGGSLWVTACTINGSGSVSADGGAANGAAGAGGGGRVAFTYTCADDFSGTVTVASGTGGMPGSAGTVNSQKLATLDIDENGAVAPLSDGLLLVRFLFGFSGDTLTDDVVDLESCGRCDSADIHAYLTGLGLVLDIDGNLTLHGLTDGLLMLRYLFDFVGPALTNGAVGNGCTRCDANAIEPYLDSLD